MVIMMLNLRSAVNIGMLSALVPPRPLTTLPLQYRSPHYHTAQ
jgi:hypothetical protein